MNASLRFTPRRAAGPLLALAGLVGLAAAPARADLLISPTGGSTITFTSGGTADPDDGSALRNLGGSFSLYGTARTSLYVQADGFLSVADGFGYLSDRGVGALAGVVGSPVIAPLYDDLYVDSSVGGVVSDRSVAGSYYAATFSNINGYTDFTAAASSTFQTALFFGNTTIGGFNFLAGDIAMSYGRLNSTIQSSTFTTGVAQNATNFTGAPGTTDGQRSSFAGLPTGNQFILFRPSGNTYLASIQSTGTAPAAVPEPSQTAAMGLGLMGLAGLMLTAKKRKAVSAVA